ncbi:leucine-rich repeat receptor protein kinase HPCA1-like [Henckelia pumila]|uniref:leucine-rich repeat receptor protein kinase HPCA1-like n=1 Tax=Henckelia pumila TaxID=405737 RepID=UPI003C6E0D96
MIWRFHLSLLVALVQVSTIAALTSGQDFPALKALKDAWENVPANWVGADPCGDGWDGVSCTNNRIVSITLASTGLSGQLTSDIGGLSELLILDLSYNKGLTGSLPSFENLKKLTSLILVGCGFSGPIPPSVGSLQKLVFLSLNSNNFIGGIPPSIGHLSNLYWLDLADNKLSGTIPVSNATSPGLDMLVGTKHFHFGNNQLSGEIPSQLFSSNMTLIHVLFENNQLTGRIPSTLGLVRSLEVLRLDKNALNGSVSANFSNLTRVQELFLANNRLTGPLPDLSGLNVLSYVDVSNNSFDATDIPPWFSSLQSLNSLIMDKTQIQGQLPVSLFSLSQLQIVSLKNNRINGTLNIGADYSRQLQLIDLQNNFVDAFTQRAGYNIQIVLVGNPICEEGTRDAYCSITQQSFNNSYSTPAENCVPPLCASDQISSPKCKCAYPYTGTLVFRAPSFSFGNSSVYNSLEQKLMVTFQSRSLPVDSVFLSNPTKNLDNYLELSLQVFPSGQDYFNRSGISGIGFILSNQTFKPPREFGPFYFIGNSYAFFPGLSADRSHKSLNNKVIIGAAVGGAVIVLLLLIAGVYAFRHRRRAEMATQKSDPFASWEKNKDSGGVPQIKGAKCFSFEELQKSTNNFSEANEIGGGGYGKVYRGTLPNGQLVAVKRARQGSIHGGQEFKSEIELLSRVHHKNVVSLEGFCFEQGEQLLVYEYIANGTLRDSLSGKIGIRLDWTRRLRIALGAAKGVQYLHDLANPPIIHRDIKSNNILLDDRLNAKVTDFGLSKPMDESQKGHVTTQVKGTMGYLDPEYYMTQQLTEKSDVYSFGVLLLELITARTPIERGRYIVREVKVAMDVSKDMYGLQDILDPIIASSMPERSAEKFVDLSLRCVHESGYNRPTMSEVVKELENIMALCGLNPNAESASSSASYGVNRGYDHPYSNESLVSYSAGYLPTRLEPK